MRNSDPFDTIIIGAGPAGSAAAALLAEQGLRVLVLEREKFPRYHIGESLLPFTCYPLKRLGPAGADAQERVCQEIQRAVCFALRQGIAAVLFFAPATSRRWRRPGRCCARNST